MTSIWKTAKLKMAAYSSWATLPSIIIVEILSYLSLSDKLSATSTCKRWRNCLFHPSLWRKVSFKVNNGNRKRTKHLADMCGKFVREVELQFRSQNASNVREFLRVLNILSENSNLKKLTIIPTSCQVAWPEREPRDAVDL
eukprot:GHVU01213528.1.p1 GENE.GHVU01213528.1~~GHVU01213528.1.p1  ORF type:complete len:141 (+),score=10.82 GHVU01213528.1:127-549(+)